MRFSLKLSISNLLGHPVLDPFFLNNSQVSCNYGRDKFESWGRKRRKRREVQVPANVIDTNNEVDALMRLSHEIVVLDLGDEQTNPFDFDAPSTYRNGNFLSIMIFQIHG